MTDPSFSPFAPKVLPLFLLTRDVAFVYENDA